MDQKLKNIRLESMIMDSLWILSKSWPRTEDHDSYQYLVIDNLNNQLFLLIRDIKINLRFNKGLDREKELGASKVTIDQIIKVSSRKFRNKLQGICSKRCRIFGRYRLSWIHYEFSDRVIVVNIYVLIYTEFSLTFLAELRINLDVSRGVTNHLPELFLPKIQR